jgi:hypothetical protein
MMKNGSWQTNGRAERKTARRLRFANAGRDTARGARPLTHGWAQNIWEQL